MNKLRVLVRAPALTFSGYGVHSRQVLFALLNQPSLDVYLESVNWGNCAFLHGESNEVMVLKQLAHRYNVAKAQGQDKNWDIFISITIPNEFERRGNVNVGITAAAETDRCSHEWLTKCNEMDFIVTPSLHAQKNLSKTVFNWENKQTGESGQLGLQKPSFVCPEGFIPQFFHKKQELTTRVKDIEFTAPFNFLVVGQWGNGGFGDDRKNIANTILYFLKAFRNRKDVGLILKVNMSRNSKVDENFIKQRILAIKNQFPKEECPPIELLHESLSDEEMGELYNHPQVKCMLSLTQGEGFGLPLLEAAACELPIVATGWSAYTEFLAVGSERLFSAISYDLKPIPQAAVWEPILVKDSKWAVPSEDDSIRRMRKIVDSYSIPKAWAQRLAKHVHEKYNLAETQKTFLGVLQHGIGALQKNNNTPEGLLPLIEDQEAYNILYTMPMSTGDVFISTAVINGLKKSVEKDLKAQKDDSPVHVYFATTEKYRDVLEDNPDITKVITWQESMLNATDLNDVFDLVLTPNSATQFTFSNWIKPRWRARLLLEEFANHCNLNHNEIGNYFIKKDDSVFTDVIISENGEVDLRHMPFVTLHTGSGKENWSARKYDGWQEVVFNIKKYFPEIRVVQVGAEDEPKVKGVDINMLGRTSVHQLAALLEKSKTHISIDTFSMHLAASMHVPLVSIFGSSSPDNTGPWYKNPDKEAFALLESKNKMGCNRPCYKYVCKVSPGTGCSNEIDEQEIVNAVVSLLTSEKVALRKVS